MTPDPLDGYRASNRDDEFSPEELLLRRQMADNAKLIQLVQRSEALQRWLESPEGEGLQDQVNIRLNEAMKVWLHAADPCSAEVKRAHFDARVALGALEMVESVLGAGPEARRLVEISDRQANAEISSDE
jgi:hypothetical protein